jgi:hypothetical protein
MPTLQPCPRCSKRLPSDARFCRRCGLALSARTAGPAALRPTPVRGPSGARKYAGSYPGRAQGIATRYGQPGSRGWVPFLILFGIGVVAAYSVMSSNPREVAPPTVSFPAAPYIPPRLTPPTYSFPNNPLNGPGMTDPLSAVPPTYVPQRPLIPLAPTVPTPPVPPNVLYPPYPKNLNDRDWGRPAGEPNHEDRTDRDSREQRGR